MKTFALQPEIQRKALNKALQSPFIGKHGKRKATLEKEEIYEFLQQKILSKMDKLIDAYIEIALKGNNGKPNPKVIEYLLNRVFGRPSQEISVKNNSDGMGKILDNWELEDEIDTLTKNINQPSRKE